MRLTLVQINPQVGDVTGNVQRLFDLLEAEQGKTDLLLLPELYLSGYPPKDLLLRPAFLQELDDAIEKLIQASWDYPRMAILVGTPRRRMTEAGVRLCNSALLIAEGSILLEQHKALLPTYDVFDEARYFDALCEHKLVSWCGMKLGICICEDAWNEAEGVRADQRYAYNPVAALVQAGAEVILNLSASPFHRGKEQLRYQIGVEHVRKYKHPFVLVNQVGANDELIFDGFSFALAKDGSCLAALPGFSEACQTIDLSAQEVPAPTPSLAPPQETDHARRALVLGVRDYFRKTGAKTALVGLSGGIDSALVACIAAEALGCEHVYGLTMPGPYSSIGSWTDSKKLATNLGIQFALLPIHSIFHSFLSLLEPMFKKLPADTTEENVQARIRGNLLMAIANKFGHLVLATGNKSELSVGYATLYGDMVGALSVIGDLFKQQVYELAHSYNSPKPLIPKNILTKPPSAELSVDQKDSDSLPPYEVLDTIVRLYVEEGIAPADIIAAGQDADRVQEVIGLIRRNEYKRLQAPPVLRVTHKSFGLGRRMPLTARYQNSLDRKLKA